jgi:hypothetical protein
LNNCKTILCTDLGPAQCYSTDPVGFSQPTSFDRAQRDSTLSRHCFDRCQRRVSLLPSELHAPPMPPPVSEASSRRSGCDLTRATAARLPVTSRPTLLTSCHHCSTRCTCSHRTCTLPPHSRSGGNAIHSFFPSYRRAPATPLELPSPPCLGHRRPPPPVLLRPHLLHPEHRPSPRDLNVHFNASLDPFSGLPPTTLHHPSMPSWRATLGEPPTAFCLKSEPPSPRATPGLFPHRPTTVGRPNFTGKPPASGGGGQFPSLVSSAGPKLRGNRAV